MQLLRRSYTWLLRRRAEPTVSVVLPVFNKAIYLEACLESIIAQTGISLEIICIDDASEDDSAEILARYARTHRNIFLLKNSENRGAAYSRNLGISAAHGRYVQFTDADDLMAPEGLSRLYECAIRTSSDVVRGHVYQFKGMDNIGVHQHISLQAAKEERTGTLLETPEMWIPWYHTAFLFSRDLLQRNNLSYPSLRVGEDPVFVAEALVRSDRVSLIPWITYFYRLRRRPRPCAVDVEQYLRHAELVRESFGSRFEECWRTYSSFVSENLTDYILSADLTSRQRAQFLNQAQQLQPTSGS